MNEISRFFGIAIATSLGLLIGIARLSGTWIVSAVARMYVEVSRNTPLLLQLLFWYTLTQGLPGPAAALNPLPGVYLCFRGLFLPFTLFGLALDFFVALACLIVLCHGAAP